jgi:hypothetical protein
MSMIGQSLLTQRGKAATKGNHPLPFTGRGLFFHHKEERSHSPKYPKIIFWRPSTFLISYLTPDDEEKVGDLVKTS